MIKTRGTPWRGQIQGKTDIWQDRRTDKMTNGQSTDRQKDKRRGIRNTLNKQENVPVSHCNVLSLRKIWT